MFFVVSKIMYFIFSPLSWIIFLFALAVIKKKRSGTFVIIGLSCLLLFSNVFLFNQCMRVWEKPYIDQKDLSKQYKFGIVLSGMSIYRGDVNRLTFIKSADRLWQTVELYQKGFIEKIWLTGGPGSMLNQKEYESEYLKNYLVGIGISDTDIVVEKFSRNTHENALFTVQKLDSLNLKNSNFLLITSAFHMRRALACFEKYGLKPDIYPTDQYYQPSRSVLKDVFIPDIRAVYGWNVLIHEWFGMIAYKIVGYI